MFGGFNLFGNGASVSKTFSNLPSHWSLQISFLFMKIDSWSDSYVYVYFDGILFSQKKPFIDYYSMSSSCGTPDIDNEMPYRLNSTHNASSFTINITTNLDGDASWKSWGITRFIFSIDKCYVLCKSCFNSGRYNCLTCYPGATLLATHECVCNSGLFFYIDKCLNPCPVGFYGDSVDSFCKICNPICENCFGPNNNQCSSCPVGSFLFNQTCLKNCPINTFSDLASRTCVYSCFPLNKYNNYIDFTCGYCDASCLNCTGPLNNQCLSCNKTNGLIFYNNYCLQNCSNNQSLLFSGTNVSCLNVCPDGYFTGYNSTLKICQNCNLACQKCYGPSQFQCYNCTSGFYYYNLSCLQTCPANTYFLNNSCLSKTFFLIDNLFFLFLFRLRPQLSSVCSESGEKM